MKSLVAVIFCTFLFSATYAQSKKTETVTIKTQINCDHCLQCGSCGTTLHEAIREEKGIKRVKIDSEANTITVKYNSEKTSAEAIRKSIADAGYDADDLKADPAAYSKLDGCCKPN